MSKDLSYTLTHTPTGSNHVWFENQMEEYYKNMYNNFPPSCAKIIQRSYNGRGVNVGLFDLSNSLGELWIECYIHPAYVEKDYFSIMVDRIACESRVGIIYLRVKNIRQEDLKNLLKWKWVEVKEDYNDTMKNMFGKDYRFFCKRLSIN